MILRKLHLALPSLFVLIAVGCGGNGGSASGNQPSRLNVSMTSQNTFSPVTLIAKAGNIVRWTNDDSHNHTITPDDDSSGMTGSDSAHPNGIGPGGTFDFKVPDNAAQGTKFFYHCRFHGTAGDGTSLGTGMVGVIQVGQPSGQTHDVDMKDMVYNPVTVHAKPGEKVRWTNSENLPHTITGDVDSQGLSSDTQFPNGLSNGDTFTFTVPTDAVSGAKIFYHCRFHGSAGNGTSLGSGMAGVVVVD